MCRASGCLRGVQYKCGIEPDVSRICQARQDITSSDDILHLLLSHTPKPMRSRCDEQGGICLRDWIEVDPQRHHVLQDAHRWRDVQKSLFLCPRPEAWRVDLLLDADRPVLMPAKRPVGRFALVEKYSADRFCTGAKRVACGSAEMAILAENLAQATLPVKPKPSSFGGQTFNGAFNRRQRS